MTVRTMPVQPGRAAGPAGPGPWPWRGMLWVTWRQHRGLLTSVPAVFVAAVAFMLVTGPPVIARELENGTFRYAWTQGIGRVRWTIAKLAFLASLVTVLALAASQLFTWYFAPFLPAENLSVLTPPVFGTRALSYAAWTLTAFCLGAFHGMLTRRVIPAMAATLAVYAGLAALTWFYLRDHYPVSTFWPMQAFEAGWRLVLSLLLIAATVRLVRHHAT